MASTIMPFATWGAPPCCVVVPLAPPLVRRRLAVVVVASGGIVKPPARTATTRLAVLAMWVNPFLTGRIVPGRVQEARRGAAGTSGTALMLVSSGPAIVRRPTDLDFYAASGGCSPPADRGVTLAGLTSDPGTDCRLGVLAFGDSITNGGGELQWGVALQSWALWVARGLGLPFTSHAVDGAWVGDVLGEQIPAFERRTARPGARYDLGCLYIGVNDVRAPGWDAAAFERDFAAVFAFVSGRCERTLALTAPLDLGRPRAGAKVPELNAAIVGAAAGTRALVVDLSDLRARNWIMADRVHPTAFGQIAIAERALDVLARDGLAPTVRPSTLIDWETTRWKRLRGDATYVYRYVKDALRAAARS